MRVSKVVLRKKVGVKDCVSKDCGCQRLRVPKIVFLKTAGVEYCFFFMVAGGKDCAFQRL